MDSGKLINSTELKALQAEAYLNTGKSICNLSWKVFANFEGNNSTDFHSPDLVIKEEGNV